MIVKKQYLKTKPICKVTFKLSKQELDAPDTVHIVGEFNNWNKAATSMKNLKNGSFKATLDLEKNNEYQYRYLINKKEWKNDSTADKYIYSAYGDCDNSVVVV